MATVDVDLPHVKEEDQHHHGPAKGIGRWLYTTNHKDIGSMYLIFSLCMFMIGGIMALIIGLNYSSQVCNWSSRISSTR